MDIACSQCNEVITGRTWRITNPVCFTCKQKNQKEYYWKNRDKLLAQRKSRDLERSHAVYKKKGGEEV